MKCRNLVLYNESTARLASFPAKFSAYVNVADGKTVASARSLRTRKIRPGDEATARHTLLTAHKYLCQAIWFTIACMSSVYRLQKSTYMNKIL